VRLLKTYLQVLVIIFLSSQIFAKTDSKLKVFENNVLIGEIKTIQNKKLFSVNDFIEITKSKKFINDKTQKVVFYVDNKKIKISNQVTFIEIEDNLFQLASKVINQNDNYYVPTESFFGIIQNLSISSSIKYTNDEIRLISISGLKKTIKTVDLRSEKEKWEFKTIVIDAGHGGKDPGAVGYRGTKEKDIALDVAKRLEKSYPKYER
jgi:N-acetylmuramoyl-L-alanine amidase